MTKKRDPNNTRPLEPQQPQDAENCFVCGHKGYATDPRRYPSERTCPNCGSSWDVTDPPPARYKAY